MTSTCSKRSGYKCSSSAEIPRAGVFKCLETVFEKLFSAKNCSRFHQTSLNGMHIRLNKVADTNFFSGMLWMGSQSLSSSLLLLLLLEMLSCNDEYEYEYEFYRKTIEYVYVSPMQALCCIFLVSHPLKIVF